MHKSKSLNSLEMNFDILDENDLYDVNGGAISFVIMGVLFTGWKAAALIAAGVTTLSGAAALGLWNGFNSVK